MTKKTSRSRKSKRLSLKTRLALGLILVGLIAAGVSLVRTWQAQHSSAAAKPLSQILSDRRPDGSQPLISGTPVHITIPSVNIDLNVIPGYYYPATKSWTLSLDNAQYGVITAKANNRSGATFIYAHARVNDFGRLPKVQPGDQAIIKTDNGRTFNYKFQSSSVVTPDDTSLFSYHGQPVLILQTCTGTWWQNRQLFVFNFSGVS